MSQRRFEQSEDVKELEVGVHRDHDALGRHQQSEHHQNDDHIGAFQAELRQAVAHAARHRRRQRSADERDQEGVQERAAKVGVLEDVGNVVKGGVAGNVPHRGVRQVRRGHKHGGDTGDKRINDNEAQTNQQHIAEKSTDKLIGLMLHRQRIRLAEKTGFCHLFSLL